MNTINKYTSKYYRTLKNYFIKQYDKRHNYYKNSKNFHFMSFSKIVVDSRPTARIDLENVVRVTRPLDARQP